MKSIRRERLEREQQADVKVDGDVTDIKKLFEERGHGRYMLDMEFEPTTQTAVEPCNRHQTGSRETNYKMDMEAQNQVGEVIPHQCIFRVFAVIEGNNS
jgi:hypothetical protein